MGPELLGYVHPPSEKSITSASCMRDQEFRLAHSIEFFDDYPQQLGRSLLVSRPNRLYARARLEDGRLFHTPVCKEYTRWVFCMLSGKPIMHHQVCPTMTLGFLLLSSRGFFSSHDSTPQLAHCKIKVCLFQGPVGFVLEFDQKMACLSIYQLVRSTPDGCFVCCAESP
nr:hypothetical protein [Tanacetum cinerariifolium]